MNEILQNYRQDGKLRLNSDSIVGVRSYIKISDVSLNVLFSVREGECDDNSYFKLRVVKQQT